MASADVHYGRAETMIAQRERPLHRASVRHPERFVREKPNPQALPKEVWINRSVEDTGRRSVSSELTYPICVGGFRTPSLSEPATLRDLD